MNIKSIINPLIFGREGIDDNAWKIRTSVTNSKLMSNLRIRCQNTYLFISEQGIRKPNIFNLILLIDEPGDFYFNRITLGKGQINNQEHRVIVKGILYDLFRKSIEDKLQGIDTK